jgi:toxic protein SymE
VLTSPTIKELIMADSHSTPDTDQSGTERSLIVGYRPNVFDKSTPKIILSGKWLRTAGFDTGQQITVKVMNGCIVLMVYSEQEQRPQDAVERGTAEAGKN